MTFIFSIGCIVMAVEEALLQRPSNGIIWAIVAIWILILDKA